MRRLAWGLFSLLRGGGGGERAHPRRGLARSGGCAWALRGAKASYSHESQRGGAQNPYVQQRRNTWRQPTPHATGPLASSGGAGVVESASSRPRLHVLAAKTRSSLEEAAEGFLHSERRRLYAVYRPSPSRDASLVPSPYDYFCVLQRLSACGMGVPSKQVYSLLVELLRKPLHPSQAGLGWDLPDEAVVDLQARALEAVMSCLEGRDALAFAQKGLMPLLSPTALAGGSHSSEFVFIQAIRRRLQGGGVASAGLEASGGSIESELLATAPVVSAAAAALIRCDTTAAKQQAIELLQLASIARLRGLEVFDENVAERCAESAALIGDAETVARIVFVLYRSRGVLGAAVGPAERAGEAANGGESDRGGSAGGRGSLLSRVALGWGRPASAEERGEGGGDVAFRRATVRLLKSVLHAVLHRRHSAVDARGCRVQEAVRLFDSLRLACAWDGAAAMAVELLTHVGAEARRRLSREPQDGGHGDALLPSPRGAACSRHTAGRTAASARRVPALGVRSVRRPGNELLLRCGAHPHGEGDDSSSAGAAFARFTRQAAGLPFLRRSRDVGPL
ncbi:primary-amine oxidase [Trypanosoma conorhini]|uniref:Primary-amine oxidase n=1 Tax=Trypanosoma conorhini TaxID=83891 RepID=A0A422MPE6_9TRYP|nr:primary-amine oxidase [Trypanosoma conorhini]RNE95067.1 primary-amine oxidase [Trypanosoma conorhini]